MELKWFSCSCKLPWSGSRCDIKKSKSLSFVMDSMLNANVSRRVKLLCLALLAGEHVSGVSINSPTVWPGFHFCTQSCISVVLIALRLILRDASPVCPDLNYY